MTSKAMERWKAQAGSGDIRKAIEAVKVGRLRRGSVEALIASANAIGIDLGSEVTQYGTALVHLREKVRPQAIMAVELLTARVAIAQSEVEQADVLAVAAGAIETDNALDFQLGDTSALDDLQQQLDQAERLQKAASIAEANARRATEEALGSPKVASALSKAWAEMVSYEVDEMTTRGEEAALQGLADAAAPVIQALYDIHTKASARWAVRDDQRKRLRNQFSERPKAMPTIDAIVKEENTLTPDQKAAEERAAKAAKAQKARIKADAQANAKARNPQPDSESDQEAAA